MSIPFMQLYVADYLGDTRHLTTEQHGAYLLLLMTMWRAAAGTLPDDPKRLARIVGCTASRWARIAPEVMAFFDVEDGVISNKRLKLELKKASEKSNQRAVSGSLGGKAKALKDKGIGVAKAKVLPCHSLESESEIATNVAIGPSPKSNPRPRPLRFVPDGWVPKGSHRAKAFDLGVDLDVEVQNFRNHEYAKPKTDFDRAFHTWLGNAKKFNPKAQSDAKLDARHENYRASWAGADQASAVLAARRNL